MEDLVPIAREALPLLKQLGIADSIIGVLALLGIIDVRRKLGGIVKRQRAQAAQLDQLHERVSAIEQRKGPPCPA